MNAMNAPKSIEAAPLSQILSRSSDHGEHISQEASAHFKRDVVAGLTSSPKTLPCKYFYDTRGSELFEEICKTPEYYVTRTELVLLKKYCPIVAQKVGPSADVLEPGSGAGEKIRLLLDSLKKPRSFIPIDISKSAVEASAAALETDYPDLDLVPLVADFTHPFALPGAFLEKTPHRKLIFFPGSTISNFAYDDAKEFMESLRSVLSAGDFLFIGVDRVKSKKVLEAAYDDAAGVTAEFNLNLLDRIARELGSNIDRSLFEHRSVFNEAESRIEMHLVSREDQVFDVAGTQISVKCGESIHTENSYKYTVQAFHDLAGASGFEVEETFSDADSLFSLYLCRVPS